MVSSHNSRAQRPFGRRSCWSGLTVSHLHLFLDSHSARTHSTYTALQILVIWAAVSHYLRRSRFVKIDNLNHPILAREYHSKLCQCCPCCNTSLRASTSDPGILLTSHISSVLSDFSDLSLIQTADQHLSQGQATLRDSVDFDTWYNYFRSHNSL